MKIDCLIAEIGSTTTIVNAFHGLHSDSPVFLGSGFAPTSVLEGDVNIGLDLAKAALCKELNVEDIECKDYFATSSAAGGLRISVHGLVYEMTVKAARESALGAGGIIILTTAGKLTNFDVGDIEKAKPSLVLLSGGTDYGEKETAVFNASALTALSYRPPIIYAGNLACRMQVKDILMREGFKVYITDNVYPSLDDLNVEPAKKIISEVFEEHIVKARGMERVRERINGSIVPTPGAVMLATELLSGELGDVLTIDIGGATTDIHSVTRGAEELQRLALNPEPYAKRTVEGDLGVYVNAKNLITLIGIENLDAELNIDSEKTFKTYRHIPNGAEQTALIERIAFEAGRLALKRHAGIYKHIYGATGRKTFIAGKDLTAVNYYIATGGALTRLPHREDIMRKLTDIDPFKISLLPEPANIKVFFDNDYIMASLGVMSIKYPDAAKKLLMKSLNILPVKK